MISSLLVTDRIRATIRRMFSGTHAEVIAELLQNAQRVKATEVSFRVETADGVTTLHYADNGPGLRGPEAFFRLLALGASGYDAATEQAQNPMGFGFNALLAHEDVVQVVVCSGGYRLAIDAEAWWNDTAYAESWQERLKPCSGAAGLTLTVTYRKDAAGPGWQTFEQSLLREVRTQACSYYGYFTALLNGEAVPQEMTELLDASLGKAGFAWDGSLSDGTPIRWVRFSGWEPYNLYVRWYGQMMSERLSSGIPSGWALYLDVCAGQPIDLVAPTRKNVIRNEKFERVLREAKHALFHAINAMPAPEDFLVKVMRELDFSLFDKESQFGLVSTWMLDELPANRFSDRDRLDFDVVVTEQQVRQQLADGTLFQLQAPVNVVSRFGHVHPGSAGIGSFLPYAPKHLTLVSNLLVPAHWGEVPELHCYWQPGPLLAKQPAEGFTLHEPGLVAWQAGDSRPNDEAFKALPRRCHVHAGDTSLGPVAELDVTVGTYNFEAYLDQYQRSWQSGDERERELAEADFWNLRRSFRGNAIPKAFTLSDIANYLEPEEFVLSLKLHYPRLDQPVERPAPAAVTVATSLGRKLKLALYA